MFETANNEDPQDQGGLELTNNDKARLRLQDNNALRQSMESLNQHLDESLAEEQA